MITLVKIFTVFFKLGAFSFGGGYPMILLMQREIVDNQKWMKLDEFLPILTLAQSAPGPMVVNTAISIGYRTRRTYGALVAALGSVLPSFIVMILIALLFREIADNEIVIRIFKGVRPAVVSLILTAVIAFAKTEKPWTYLVSIATSLAIFYGVSPLIMILAGIITGVLYTYINRKKIIK